ncbi:hypothetical protein [Pseudomonas leptonychotis]|jgi:hypothetical protein|uniref:hypothetical protein n=1 Tax=Pseudomonas leptonychotis TaxID=2448482 RepID=UPI0039F0A81D
MAYEREASIFGTARQILMLPHVDGVAVDVARAMGEIDFVLKDMDRTRLDGSAVIWLRELAGLMDFNGISDPELKGRAQVKAESFGVDDLLRFSLVVNDLASWFEKRCD